MGKFGSQTKGQGDDGANGIENLGKNLAKASMGAIKKETVDYFKR